MNNEFKKISSKDQTVYTLESATSGGTGSSSIASVSSPLGGMQKRNPPGDNILAQEAGKEKEAPRPRNFVAKNAKMGGAGKMKDKSKTIPRHEKHKKPVAEGFNGEYDDEAGMAHSNLLTSARAVMGLLKTIEDKDNLPEWAQEKIAKAEMMLVSVWDYLQSQKEQGIDPKVEAYGRYNRRDAYQRDYDSSIAGMNRRNDHRDDERHDLDDVQLQRNRQEVTYYNITIDGKPINPKPIFGRSATIAWGKEQAAAGVDLSNAMISPAREGVAEVSNELRNRYVARASDDYGSANFAARASKSHPGLEKYGQEQEARAKKRAAGLNRALSDKRRGQGVAESEYESKLKEMLDLKLAEKIPPNATVDYYIQDFSKSNAPQFRGKTKEKRKQMAVAAYYGSKQPKKKKK
jgi:hypothetical protein